MANPYARLTKKLYAADTPDSIGIPQISTNGKISRLASYIHECNRDVFNYLKDSTKAFYNLAKQTSDDMKNPWWYRLQWKFHKYDLIPIALSIGAATLVGLAKTRYDLDMKHVANVELGAGPDAMKVGEYFSQGKIPVQQGFGDAVKLGHPSWNPLDYVQPSVQVKVNPNEMPTIISFTSRDMTQAESSLVQAWQNGEFTGLKEYAVIAAADIAYAAVRTGVSARKNAEEKLEQKS